MKKLFTTLFSLALILSLPVLTSCGSSDKKSEDKEDNKKVNTEDILADYDDDYDHFGIEGVIEKYNDDEDLTESDYGVLIDYISAAMDEAIPLAKEIQKAYENGDDAKVEELQEKGQELEEKYPYMEKALNIIQNTDDEDLGSKNLDKAKKLLNRMMEVY